MLEDNSVLLSFRLDGQRFSSVFGASSILTVVTVKIWWKTVSLFVGGLNGIRRGQWQTPNTWSRCIAKRNQMVFLQGVNWEPWKGHEFSIPSVVPALALLVAFSVCSDNVKGGNALKCL